MYTGSENYGHFTHSDLLLIIGEKKEDIIQVIESILNSKHEKNIHDFLSYANDPKDLILSLIPNNDPQLFKISIIS